MTRTESEKVRDALAETLLNIEAIESDLAQVKRRLRERLETLKSSL